jgi:short-subunit dehydrogenase
VLITGASRGIGAQIALQYARAGASLSLVARTQSSLDASKDTILRELPSAQVLTFPADVRDVKRAEEVVAGTVAHFGRLDILIANAGILRPMDKRALRLPTRIISAILVVDSCCTSSICVEGSERMVGCSWGQYSWALQLHPVRLIYFRFISQAYDLLLSFAVPELLKTKGQVVIVASGAGQVRVPNASEYCISKHAILRFAEFIKMGKY